MKIKRQHFSRDKQNFQAIGCLSKEIIEMQEAIKLVLDEIVNHPSQISPRASHLSTHCYILKSFCSLHSWMMMFLMMVLYLVSCNQKFWWIIKVLFSRICVEKSMKILFGEWLQQHCNIWCLWPRHFGSTSCQSARQCVRNLRGCKQVYWMVWCLCWSSLTIAGYHPSRCTLHHFSSFSVPWKGDMHESHRWVHLSSGFWIGLANKKYQQEVKCWEDSEMSIYFLQAVCAQHSSWRVALSTLLPLPLGFGDYSTHHLGPRGENAVTNTKDTASRFPSTFFTHL